MGGSGGGVVCGQPDTIRRASGFEGAGLRTTLQRETPDVRPDVVAATRQPLPERVAVIRTIRSPHSGAFARTTARTAAIACGFVSATRSVRALALGARRQSPSRAVAASDPRHTGESSHPAGELSIEFG